MFRLLTLLALLFPARGLTVPDDLVSKLRHAMAVEDEVIEMAHEDRYIHHGQHGHDERLLLENPRCSICPEGQAMSKPDFVLPLDSDDEITCSDARFLGAAGLIDEEDCADLAAILAGSAFCHCVPEAQTDENPKCSVCGEGLTIGKPDYVAAETSSGRELTCQDLDNLGFARELSPALCSQIAQELTGPSRCMCLAEKPPSTSSPGETIPSTAAPTTSPPIITDAPTAGAVPRTEMPTESRVPPQLTDAPTMGMGTAPPTMGMGLPMGTTPPTTSAPEEVECDDIVVTLQTEHGPALYCCKEGGGDFAVPSFNYDECDLLGEHPMLEPESTDVIIWLSLTTDRYGEEVSFTLTDRLTGAKLWDLPRPREFFDKFTAYTFEIGVDPAGCYDFEILDTFSDGLSEGGEGGFTLHYNNEVVLTGVNYGAMAGTSMGSGCDDA